MVFYIRMVELLSRGKSCVSRSLSSILNFSELKCDAVVAKHATTTEDFFFELLPFYKPNIPSVIMNISDKFRVNPDFKVEKFDNEVLLYAVSNTKGIYLNETANLVWEMCGKSQSVKDIIDTLQELYPEQAEAIASDVLAAVKSLVEYKALVIDNE